MQDLSIDPEHTLCHVLRCELLLIALSRRQTHAYPSFRLQGKIRQGLGQLSGLRLDQVALLPIIHHLRDAG